MEMNKVKFKFSYPLRQGSSNIVWTIISSAIGLETWFADKVSVKGKTWSFQWGKTETREAELLLIRNGNFIRFHWLDDETPKTYFELKLLYNELTEDLMLEITDFGDADEEEDIKDLWDTGIDKLKRVSGL